MSTDEQTQQETEQLKLAIPDVYLVAQALDLAIKRKTFSEEEIQKIYAPWSRVIRFCEDIRRKSEVEELYKKEDVKEESKLETVQEQ